MMTFWSYGYALGEADESDLEERPRRVTLGRDETLREKNRSLSVSVLFIIVATALTVDDFLKLWLLLR